MNNIIQAVYYISLVIITFMVGFPVILLSKDYVKNWIPKSFIFGTALLMLITFWVSWIDKSGLRVSSRVIVVICILAGIIVGSRRRDAVKRYIKDITVSDGIGFAICIIAGMIPLLMMIVFGAQFPYCDGYTYICNADYLLKNGYRVLVEPNDTILHPWLSQTYIYQNAHFRIGSQMLLALFSGIWNVKFSIEMFLPVISYGVFLCGMGSWLLVSDKYCANSTAKIVAVIFIVFNVPIILWNAIYGFLPQIFGSALFIAAVASMLKLINWKENCLWEIITSSTIIAGLSLAYNEMLPFFVLVTFFIVSRDFWENRSKRAQIVKKVFCCGSIAALLIIVYFPGMIKAIFYQFGAVVGWNQEKEIFTYLGYFLSTVPAEYSFQVSEFNMTMNVVGILTLAVFGIVVIGFHNSDIVRKKDFAFITIPYVILLVYFMFVSKNPFAEGRGNTWSIFKLLQYYYIVASPYLALFIAEFCIKKSRLIVRIMLFSFVAFNGFSSIHYLKAIAHNMEIYVGAEKNSLDEYYKLYNHYKNVDGIVELIDVPQKHRQMITYFLQDIDLVSDWNSDVYFGSIPDVPEELCNAEIRLVYDLDSLDNIAGLVELDLEDVNINLGEGFYGKETAEDRYWNWSKKESELEINGSGAYGQVKLDFEVYVLEYIEEPQTLDIYSEEGLIRTIEINSNEVISESIILDSSVKTLKFVYSGNSEIPGENDMRSLAFCFCNYKAQTIN